MGRIGRFTSRIEAEIGRSALEAAGIPAHVTGDDAGGLHPEIPFAIGGTVLVVPDDRHREACDVLAAEAGAFETTSAPAATRSDEAIDSTQAPTPGAGVPAAETPVSGGRTHGPRLPIVVGAVLALVVVGALFLLLN